MLFLTAPKVVLRQSFFALLALTALAACEERGDDAGAVSPPSIELGTPDNFFEFFNLQRALPAGTYEVVATTRESGVSGSYTLNIINDRQQSALVNGVWSNSSGDNPSDTAYERHAFVLDQSGGIQVDINSSAAANLYLFDRYGNLLSQAENSASILLDASRISNFEYSSTYYQTIDPCSERTTRRDWMLKNGFNPDDRSVDMQNGDYEFGADAQVVYRNKTDLGYGRKMHVRQEQDGSNPNFGAVYAVVENFQVNVLPGAAYGKLNLIAAVDREYQYHFGTNAIEFSHPEKTVGNNADGSPICEVDTSQPKFTKFYNFHKDGSRMLLIDLDGRGEKSMPTVCVTCHGALRATPLLADGSFPNGGNFDAHMHPWNVDIFELSDIPGFTKEDLQDEFKLINTYVHSTYPNADDSSSSNDPENLGKWTGSAQRDLVEGWYGSTDAGESFPATTFIDDYVPEGWRHDPTDSNPPPGVETLYLEVVARSCRTCHYQRGKGYTGGNDVDFSTYERFISYADQIIELVYEDGRMPDAILAYDDFWDTSRGLSQAQILASFLPNFSGFNDDGSIDPPGKPIARVAAPFNTNVPIHFNAEASRFADVFEWDILSQPDNANATLDNSGLHPEFNTDRAGEYRIQLTVRNGSISDTHEFVVNVDFSLTQPQNLVLSDITSIFTSTTPNACTDCHSTTRTRTDVDEGVPVLWTRLADEIDDSGLYERIRERINFAHPELSPFLYKPTGQHHFGGALSGYNLEDEADRYNYDRVMAWILEGARQN